MCVFACLFALNGIIHNVLFIFTGERNKQTNKKGGGGGEHWTEKQQKQVNDSAFHLIFIVFHRLAVV